MRLSEASIRKVVKILSEEWAHMYQNQHGRGPGRAEQFLSKPQGGLQFFLENGFARAGGEQAGYGKIAAQALKGAISEHRSYHKLFQLSDDVGEIVWKKFVQICRQKKIGLNEKRNRGVVEGLVVLAQNTQNFNFNPYKQIALEIKHGNIFNTYMLLRRIHGIGEKISAFILRDIVTMLDTEKEIVSRDKIFFQPIDRWVDGIAKYLWNLHEKTPSWAVAYRIVEKCEEYKYSPLRFNQGAWKYGSSEIKNVRRIPEKILELIR